MPGSSRNDSTKWHHVNGIWKKDIAFDTDHPGDKGSSNKTSKDSAVDAELSNQPPGRGPTRHRTAGKTLDPCPTKKKGTHGRGCSRPLAVSTLDDADRREDDLGLGGQPQQDQQLEKQGRMRQSIGGQPFSSRKNKLKIHATSLKVHMQFLEARGAT